MGLVDDQGVVFIQPGIMLGFGQQNAVGHDLDQGPIGGLIGKPDLVTHRRADDRPQLGRYAAGDGHRRDPARLGAADPAVPAQPGGHAHLGDLGGLTGAGGPGNNDHRIFPNGGDDIRLPSGDGQAGVDGHCGEIVVPDPFYGRGSFQAVRQIGQQPGGPLFRRLSRATAQAGQSLPGIAPVQPQCPGNQRPNAFFRRRGDVLIACHAPVLSYPSRTPQDRDIRSLIGSLTSGG